MSDFKPGYGSKQGVFRIGWSHGTEFRLYYPDLGSDSNILVTEVTIDNALNELSDEIELLRSRVEDLESGRYG